MCSDCIGLWSAHVLEVRNVHESPGVRVYGFTQARESLKAILDSSERGGLSTISRPDRAPAAVVNGESLRRYLALRACRTFRS